MGSDDDNKAPAAAEKPGDAGSGSAVGDAATPAKARGPVHVPAPDINPPKTLSQKFADAVTKMVGSPKFVVAQTATLALWLLGNTLGIVQHWDPQPFILLNLMLSFQAAYTGPFVMISQNREAELDRLKEAYDHNVNREAQKSVEQLHRKVNMQLASLSPMVKLLTHDQVKALGIPDDILMLILDGPQEDEDAAAKLLAEDDPHPEPKKLTISDKFSAAVANGVGSLKFIGLQSAAIAAWLGLNTFALVTHWDPYPYILLNLMLSFQAAYTGPFVLMNQNRQNEQDRVATENDQQVNRDAKARLDDLNRKFDALGALMTPVMAALTPEQHEKLVKMVVSKLPVPQPPEAQAEKAPGDHADGGVIIPDPHQLPPFGSAGPAAAPG